MTQSVGSCLGRDQMDFQGVETLPDHVWMLEVIGEMRIMNRFVFSTHGFLL